MTTGNSNLHVVQNPNPVVDPTDNDLLGIAEEMMGTKPDPDVLAQPGVRVRLVEIWMDNETTRLEQERIATEQAAKNEETERQRLVTEQAKSLHALANKRFTPGAPKGPVVFLSREDIQKAVYNAVLEEAKKSRPELLPDWVTDKDDVAAIRGYLCGERRDILKFRTNNASDTTFVTWANEAAAKIQLEINFLTKLGFNAFQADLGEKEHWCPKPKYDRDVRPKLLQSRFFQQLTSQVREAEEVKQESTVSAETVRQKAERLQAEQMLLREIGGMLKEVGFDYDSTMKIGARLLRKYTGSAAERLTQAAIGQGVLARTNSNQSEREQSAQNAKLYAQAAGLGEDEFQALLDEHLTTANVSADKPYAVVERPLSAKQQKLKAEAARKARNAQKSGNNKNKKNKKQ